VCVPVVVHSSVQTYKSIILLKKVVLVHTHTLLYSLLVFMKEYQFLNLKNQTFSQSFLVDERTEHSAASINRNLFLCFVIKFQISNDVNIIIKFKQ